MPSWIQPCCTKLWLKLVQSDSNSFILTQLDHGSHLGFCYLGFRHCHLGFKHLVIFSQIHSKTLPPLWPWLKLIQSDYLMMATIFNSSILNSAILDSAMLHKTLTQTRSIWLKLIYSDSTWWYQPSWILPCWIQTLPSWIQTPCYLLSD